VTDHLGALGSATALAKEIRRRVRDERGLTVSVGVGPNCLVAKIASDACKPITLTNGVFMMYFHLMNWIR